MLGSKLILLNSLQNVYVVIIYLILMTDPSGQFPSPLRQTTDLSHQYISSLWRKKEFGIGEPAPHRHRKNSDNKFDLIGKSMQLKQSGSRLFNNCEEELTPLLMYLPTLTLREILHCLQKILSSIPARTDYIENLEVPLDKFLVTKSGIVIFENHKTSRQKMSYKKEAAWVHRLMERMSSFSNQSFKDFYTYFRRAELKKNVTIQYLLNLIKSYVICSKITLPSHISVRLPKQKTVTDNQNNPLSRSQKCSHKIFFTSKLAEASKEKKKKRQSSSPFFIKNLANSFTEKSLLQVFSKNKSRVKSQVAKQYSIAIEPKEKNQIKRSLTTNVTESQNDFSRESNLWEPTSCLSINRFNQPRLSGSEKQVSSRRIKTETNNTPGIISKFCFETMDLLSEVESQEEESNSQQTPRSSIIDFEQSLNCQQKQNKSFWKKRIDGLFLDRAEDLKVSVTEGVMEEKESCSPYTRKLNLIAKPICSSTVSYDFETN